MRYRVCYFLLFLLALCLFAAACAPAGAPGPTGGNSADGSPTEGRAPGGTPASGGVAQTDPQRMIVRTVTMTLVVENVRDTVQKISDLASGKGGIHRLLPGDRPGRGVHLRHHSHPGACRSRGGDPCGPPPDGGPRGRREGRLR